MGVKKGHKGRFAPLPDAGPTPIRRLRAGSCGGVLWKRRLRGELSAPCGSVGGAAVRSPHRQPSPRLHLLQSQPHLQLPPEAMVPAHSTGWGCKVPSKPSCSGSQAKDPQTSLPTAVKGPGGTARCCCEAKLLVQLNQLHTQWISVPKDGQDAGNWTPEESPTLVAPSGGGVSLQEGLWCCSVQRSLNAQCGCSYGGWTLV